MTKGPKAAAAFVSPTSTSARAVRSRTSTDSVTVPAARASRISLSARTGLSLGRFDRNPAAASAASMASGGTLSSSGAGPKTVDGATCGFFVVRATASRSTPSSCSPSSPTLWKRSSGWGAVAFSNRRWNESKRASTG